MKIFPIICLGAFFTAGAFIAPAREAALEYHFTAGETNVFAVEVAVRTENGSEVTSGNVIFVVQEVTTNSAKLSCRSILKSENKRTMSRAPGFGSGFYPGGTILNQNVFPGECEIEFDRQGHEIRDGGDYVLAAPLGKLAQSLFAPLPARSDENLHETVSVLDDPFWLGPADNFLNLRQNGQPMGMGYYYMNGQRSGLATIAVIHQATASLKKISADTTEIKRQSTFESPVRNGGEPRFSATLEADSMFSSGSLTNIEMKGDVVSQTETTSRHAKVSFKAHRLSGDDLAAALVPPPPPALWSRSEPARKLSADDLEKISSDLNSPDLDTRRAAIRQLTGVDVASPSDALVAQVAAMALDSDQFVRMTAANFLGAHATTNEVPVLIKLLKDSDWSSRSGATKALGRLKDTRAIQPLTDAIARGSNMGPQDASSALINIGGPAEKAVAALLSERNSETQRQACNILAQIGTADSLDALQKLVADSEQQTSQAAVDAIRAIKQRQ